MKYAEGQLVQVKLSGLMVKGEVIKVKKATSEYVVLFESGSEKIYPETRVKTFVEEKDRGEALPPKTAAKEKSERKSPSRATARSPGRPPRSPSRTASPSRKARASPSPSRKKTAVVTTIPKPTSARVLKVSLENIVDPKFKTQSQSEQQMVTRRKRTLESDSSSPVISGIPRVTEPRKPISKGDYTTEKILPSVEREQIIHLKSQTTEDFTKLNDIGKFSDEDDFILDSKRSSSSSIRRDRASRSETRLLGPKPYREFGGWIGALFLTVLIPVTGIALHIVCNKNSCSYMTLPDFDDLFDWKSFFDLTALGIYTAFIFIIALLSRIPFVGKRINSQLSKEPLYNYKMNGLFSAFAVLGLVIGLEIYDISVVNAIVDKYFQLMICGLYLGAILSVLLFIKSKFVPVHQLNPFAVTYNIPYDFFMGRQINPRVFGFDIKTILLRSSYIAVLILNSIFLYKSLNVTVLDPSYLWRWGNLVVDIEPALVITSALQILYIFDTLVFESQLTTTFELQAEGLGYMRVLQYSLYPFFATSSTKYLYEHGQGRDVSNWILAAILLVYIAGYILYRGSNSQKNAFRLNPYGPTVNHLDSIPTNKGKKLLISGFWSKTRHPNYLGDVMIHLSIGALSAGSPAALGVFPILLILAHRASRDNGRCKLRYSTAWDRYTHKVKYAVVPKVF